MIIPHITLNTGHVAEIDLSIVDADTIRHLRAMWPQGGKLPAPLSAYRIEFGGVPSAASFSLWRGSEPLVIAGACFDEAAAAGLWEQIESLYLDAAEIALELGTEYPERPVAPWLVIAMMPPLLNSTPPDIHLMARIEQAVAAMLYWSEK